MELQTTAVSGFRHRPCPSLGGRRRLGLWCGMRSKNDPGVPHARVDPSVSTKA